MALPPMITYFYKPLMLSLEVPTNWAKAKLPDADLNLFGPEIDNYRMNLTFNIRKIDADNPESFDELIEASYFSGNMEQSLEQYSLVDSAKFTLDDRDAFQALMHWIGEEDGVKLALTQLDLLIMTEPGKIYEIHGYALRRNEAADIPVLEHILGSIRIIPDKPVLPQEPYQFNINPN